VASRVRVGSLGVRRDLNRPGTVLDVRAKQGRRVRGGRSDSAWSPAGTQRGLGMTGGPHLSSATGAGGAKRAGIGGVVRLGQ
jgi:hypothetical protein